MQTRSSAPRPLDAVEVPLGSAVLQRILPAVETALSGGLPLLPVPTHPAPVRAALMTAMRPRDPVETVDEDRVALVVPTSGSTGDPKGVLLGAAALTASAEAAHARLGGPGHWLLALPATHVAGLMVLVRSVVAGTAPGVVDLSAGFDPEAFAVASRRIIDREASRRYTALVPRQLAVILTETCGGCVYDGVTLDGVTVATSADGRIKIAGPVLAHGYRLRPELTRQAFVDGWFVSTDLGQIDDQRGLAVFGRVDDVAVSGGVNVPLAAVDGLLTDHPGVASAATVALPDPSWGQRLVAVVVPRDPANPPTLESIRAYVIARAPTAHAPKALVLAESLPRLSSGEVDRRRLAASLPTAAPA